MSSDIEDTDTGLWQITTETSVYLIDLDHRRFRRIPGAAAGTHRTDDAVLVEVRDLPGDFGWLPLLELLMCRLGEPLLALEGTPDTETTWRQSTLVQNIRLLSTPTPDPDAAPAPGRGDDDP